MATVIPREGVRIYDTEWRSSDLPRRGEALLVNQNEVSFFFFAKRKKKSTIMYSVS